ncbi:Holliday junction branch migration protein RuvA [Gynuella sunshinyii]|uniref:Holliday junction branch migration complex subunit RuvA n=1 Tax=Gynuella sunshinyii YC6258 TaxID=1445510 RepID=A0A0C5VVX4_9GAMM|nr:Holliday junction branch migration protein RuvA [Gynuella sunshinyii]AJQ94614.1 holliday junction resolvasome, DNA-binding subunit [Gynuella sunshinyii YC6258]
MIGRLKGRIILRQPPDILIDVQGVGYELQAPMSTFYQISSVDQEAILYTHLAIREDAHQLYGFATQKERELFRKLIKTNGVGPKMALAILSGIDFDSLVSAVMDGDVSALVKIPGIGKKTAERLVIELRDRLKEYSGQQLGAEASIASMDNSLFDAESAMIALGYKPPQASKAVKQIYKPGMSSDEIIRQALKLMV